MIKVRDKPVEFAQISRTNIFGANITLYTKTDGKEAPVPHFLQKIGPNKAMTLDKSTIIYFADGDMVLPCDIVHDSKEIKQVS